jgi:cardiolipin synthase
MTYLALAGALFIVWFVLVVLFAPAIDYHGRERIGVSAPDFLHTLQVTTQAAVHEGNRVTVLTNGEQYYPAMLEAIRRATRTVTLECYIFQPGEVADRFIEALSERARAGVTVTVVVDTVGSWGSRAARQRLREAGCRVAKYQRFHWYRLARLNNRTHRELLIVDGRGAFVGGAGIADWWLHPKGHRERWRDTMARVEGPIVAALQGVFAENWLECCGEILLGEDYYPALEHAGPTTAFVVKSSPSDRATASRVMFQLLIENAERHIRIQTPYFLPDRALRRALARTARRGVAIQVIVPGRHTDQRWVRLASRRLYSRLLKRGIEIHEYDRGMTHVKALIVDDEWSVVGTTNIDNRSFEHNDEVNVAMRDPAIAARLIEDYERDLADSRRVTLDALARRPAWQRAVDWIVWILERQQ